MGRISARMSRIDSSGIRKVFDLAGKMTDPVDLSIGQPDFDVPEPVREAAVRAMRDGLNRYTVTQGIPELRERLAEEIRATRGYDPEALFVTSGVSGAIMLAFLVLLEDGDEVIIGDPYFVMYKHLAHLAGATVRFVDTYPDFRLRADAVEACVTDHTKLIVLNSPCNPTGAVMTDEEVARVAEIARRHSLIVISDRIYDPFTYTKRPVSIGELHADTILMSGFSKSHALTGWRLGYAAGPKDIIDEMIKLQQFSFVCAPSFAQYAALAAFDVDMGEHAEAYRRKRDIVCDGLRDAFDFVRPEGAFYVFPEVPWGTDLEFVEKAIKNNVLIIPGSVFSERSTHFRISYATADDQLRRGVDVLTRLARDAG